MKPYGRSLITAFLFLLASLLTMPATAQDYVDPADLADPDGHFVEINGAQVYYLERGPLNGPPVLLLHGFLGSTHSWDKAIDVLAAAGYRTIAFDRPPFGLSDKRPELDYSLNAQADITAGLMDSLKVDKATLVGHSAGGAVIANFALRHPERASRLVFVAGAVGMTGPAESGREDSFGLALNLDPESPLAQVAIRAFLTSGFAQNLMDQAFYDPSKIPPDMIETGSAWTHIQGWEAGLLAFTRDNMSQNDELDIEKLATIDVPVLLIWGEEDRIVPIAVGERLESLFPNDTWITYSRVGHMPMEENTDAFNADLLAFLASS